MSMALGERDLLAGEETILTKAANAVIRPNEYGLKRFPFDAFMPLVGMKGQEAVGGRLHLTNYRLVFASHRLNRARGTFSIFLPTITDAADVSRLATRKVSITTRSQEFGFVMWGIGAFLAALERCRREMDAARGAELVHAIQARPEVLGDELEVSRSVDLVIRGAAAVLDAVKATQGRGDASTLLNLLDLLGR